MNEQINNDKGAGFSGTLILAKAFGFFGVILSINPTFLDRWNWLKKRLPKATFREKLLDVGCGTGGITIGVARLGYNALGLSWDERSLQIAEKCSQFCNANSAQFEEKDIRTLDERSEWAEAFDVAVCFEAIEHIIDDKKLMIDIAACLKPGGRLLLTTPYYNRSLIRKDVKPFEQLEVENGGHVRLGYTRCMLTELCDHAGLIVENESYCVGMLSQKITFLMYLFKKIHPRFGPIILLPLWVFPAIFDNLIARITGYPYNSICIEAYKPRFKNIA